MGRTTKIPVRFSTTLPCYHCRQEFPDDQFYYDGRSNVRRGRKTRCIDCLRTLRHRKKRAVRRQIAPGYFSCCRCNKDLPISEFYARANQVTGAPAKTPSSYCKICQRIREKQRLLRALETNPDYYDRQYAQARKRAKKRHKEITDFRMSMTELLRDRIKELQRLGWSIRQIALTINQPGKRHRIEKIASGKTIAYLKTIEELHTPIYQLLQQTRAGKIHPSHYTRWHTGRSQSAYLTDIAPLIAQFRERVNAYLQAGLSYAEIIQFMEPPPPETWLRRTMFYKRIPRRQRLMAALQAFDELDKHRGVPHEPINLHGSGQRGEDAA